MGICEESNERSWRGCDGPMIKKLGNGEKIKKKNRSEREAEMK